MREVPQFIVDRVVMCTLLIDKSLGKSSFNDRFEMLKNSVHEYISITLKGFISNHSKEFQEYLEERVGKVKFTKSFAVRVRSDGLRLFIMGKEIFDDKKVK